MTDNRIHEFADISSESGMPTVSRLGGEILLFCNQLEEHGYSNVTICNALITAAVRRMKRENNEVAGPFYRTTHECLGAIAEACNPSN